MCLKVASGYPRFIKINDFWRVVVLHCVRNSFFQPMSCEAKQQAWVQVEIGRDIDNVGFMPVLLRYLRVGRGAGHTA